jgi:hypothetical protein
MDRAEEIDMDLVVLDEMQTPYALRALRDVVANRIGTPPWIVDHAVLGHARPKLLRTHMPTLPLGEARDALERWGRELAGIVEPAGALRRAPALRDGLGQECDTVGSPQVLA